MPDHRAMLMGAHSGPQPGHAGIRHVCTGTPHGRPNDAIGPATSRASNPVFFAEHLFRPGGESPAGSAVSNRVCRRERATDDAQGERSTPRNGGSTGNRGVCGAVVCPAGLGAAAAGGAYLNVSVFVRGGAAPGTEARDARSGQARPRPAAGDAPAPMKEWGNGAMRKRGRFPIAPLPP